MTATSTLRAWWWSPVAGFFGLVLGGVWVASHPLVSAAQESPLPLTLRWSAPPGCPDESSISQEVKSLLRGEPSDARAPVSAVVTVRKTADGAWDVLLVTTRQGNTGERTLRADTCESAGRVAALILAIAIDPKQASAARLMPAESASVSDAPLSSAPPPTVPSASASPVASVAVPSSGSSSAAPVVPAPKRPSAAEPRLWSVGPAAALDVGSLPAPSMGLRLHGQRWFGRIGVDVYAAGWPRSTGSAPGRPQVGGDFALYLGGAGVMYNLGDGPLRWGPVVSLEGGAMRGTGVGVTNPTSVWGPWFAATAGARLSSPIVGWAAIHVESVLVAPLLRDEFVLDRIGAIHQPSAIAWRTGFGLDLAF